MASPSLGLDSSKPKQTKLEEELKDLIVAEIKRNKSLPGWQGGGVAISVTQYSVSTALAEQVNAIGQKLGCHTCGTKVEIDPDQPWVGDHSYATGLADHVLETLCGDDTDPPFEVRTKQYLFPQCHQCSGKQAVLVRRLNELKKSAIEALLGDAAERANIYRLIHGLLNPVTSGASQNCIESSGPTVSDIEGKAVQLLGTKNGCHSNLLHAVPTTRYDADHVFPQEFCTGYMPQVFDALKILDLIPKSWYCARNASVVRVTRGARCHRFRAWRAGMPSVWGSR